MFPVCTCTVSQACRTRRPWSFYFLFLFHLTVRIGYEYICYMNIMALDAARAKNTIHSLYHSTIRLIWEQKQYAPAVVINGPGPVFRMNHLES